MSDQSKTTRMPGQAPLANQPQSFAPVAEAKTLLRATRAGTLATLDAATGHPFASLVSVATDADGSPLMLMSTLSAHTRNVDADDRVSLLLARGGKGDPLAHPRLTVIGRLQRTVAPQAHRRFLARHPKAALYADFGDFAFFRLEMASGHLNGGFARAALISQEELTTDLAGAADLIETEAEALSHMNADHADAIKLYATSLLGLRPLRWRLTGLDPEGLDLAAGDETARLAFDTPIATPGQLRKVLKDLADSARIKA